MASVNTLDRLLGHVIEVETEMIALSGESHRRISEWMQNAGAKVSDDVMEAMQYQDILSQQLSATIEAVESIRAHLSQMFDCSVKNSAEVIEVIESIDAKLVEVLEKAEHKRQAFGGKVHHDVDEGIEFF